jgi:hypothetical protein
MATTRIFRILDEAHMSITPGAYMRETVRLSKHQQRVPALCFSLVQETPNMTLLRSNVRFSESWRLVTAAARQPLLRALVAAAARRQQPFKA